MIARVRTIRLTPGGLARSIEILRDNELPVLRQAPGFVGLIVLASLSDSASGERVEAVSLWEDRQALDRFDAAADQRAGVIPDMPQLAAPVEARIYDVAQAAGLAGG